MKFFGINLMPCVPRKKKAKTSIGDTTVESKPSRSPSESASASSDKSSRRKHKLLFQRSPKTTPRTLTITDASGAAFRHFITAYPEYASAHLDALRSSDFTRLDDPVSPSCYMDYTGGGLYSETLVRGYASQLTGNVFGNPHSANPSSQLSSNWTAKAKAAMLEFVDADPAVYDVVWTANATGALRIVAEGFPWRQGQALVAGSDCHNSVNGMRAFANRAGNDVEYVLLPEDGMGLQPANVEDHLKGLVHDSPHSPGIVVITAQSNITGLKAPIHSLVPLAAGLGFTTVVDAAALLPTTSISLRSLDNNLDALALSLYKMTGFPTGVGALIIKKSFLATLTRPWFCGGTVQLVQAPGDAVTMEQGAAKFEDGTQNYLSMIAIPSGLAMLKTALPHLTKRLPALLHWTVTEMAAIRHVEVGGTSEEKDCAGNPLIVVRSPKAGMGKEEMGKLHGALIAFEVLDEEGQYVNCEVIEYAASKRGISLRAGCMCNPGGAATIMGMQDMMAELKSGETKKDIQAKFGVRAAGVTRASFGLASNFQDAFTFVTFLKSLAEEGALSRATDAFYSKDRDVSAC